jgi:glucan phosphoethanolaminetransferase (alkaline phosphatase superfamily)
MLYTALKAYSVMLAILYKSPKYTIQVPGATFIMVAILISVPLRAGFHSAPYLFYPDPVKPSLYNVVNSFSLYLRQILSSQKSRQNAFLDYEIVYAEPKAQNIVLIMGESTRDDYMSLFGYNVPTTPLLDKRQGEANFSCTSILSNAVSTATSLQIFFNLMLEPGNFNAVVTKQANLFKLAKKQGYKTVLISAQSSTLLYGVGTEYIDYFISREAISDELFSKKRDLALIDLLDKTNLSNSKNFVVLHLRSQHTPYEDNYAHMKELAIHSDAAISQSDTATANRLRYENSMKFNDLVIDKIIDYTKLKLANSGETVIFFTSDHGELLGEKGLFGHNHLNVDCAKVPLLILGLNTDINKWKLDKAATHYDLGLSIADLMGIKISNPNTKNPKLRYIHGVNIMYPYAYLEFEINDINNLVNITITKRFTTEDTR